MSIRELTELDRASCIRALQRAYTGRLAYLDGERPVVVPVNFVLDEQERVVVRSVEGAKLDAAREGRVMALQIDGSDDLRHIGWSVTATGPAEIVPDGDPSLARVHLRSWSMPTTGGWIRITPELIEGRQLI